MTTSVDSLIPSFRSNRKNSQALLTGVGANIFARKPVFGETVLNMQHPAFAYGHLSLYPGIVLELLGLKSDDVAAPASYLELFKNGTPCHDDPEGTIYPAMTEIVDLFNQGYDILLERVGGMSGGVLDEPTPGERATRFPTKGTFLVHLMTSHIAGHLGQVSSWRRAMLLPPAQ